MNAPRDEWELASEKAQLQREILRGLDDACTVLAWLRMGGIKHNERYMPNALEPAMREFLNDQLGEERADKSMAIYNTLSATGAKSLGVPEVSLADELEKRSQKALEFLREAAQGILGTAIKLRALLGDDAGKTATEEALLTGIWEKLHLLTHEKAFVQLHNVRAEVLKRLLKVFNMLRKKTTNAQDDLQFVQTFASVPRANAEVES